MAFLTTYDFDIHRSDTMGDFGGRNCAEPDLEESIVADLLLKAF